MRFGCFIILLFCCCFVLGEVTVFEGEGFVMAGETNYDDSVVACGNAVCDEGESCDECMRDCGVCEGSGYFVESDVQNVSGSSMDEVFIEYTFVENLVEDDFFVARVVFLVGLFLIVVGGVWG